MSNKRKKKALNDNDLIRRRNLAKRHNNYRELIEIYNQLGDEYRHSDNISKAIRKYKKCIETAELMTCTESDTAAFAHRSIAELSVKLGDYTTAQLHAERYLDLVHRLKCVQLIQLALHVNAWVAFQSGSPALLERARDFAEQSFKYLRRNAHEIDQSVTDINDKSKRREAGLRQLMAEIFDKMGHRDEATRHLRAAMAYAMKTNDFELQHLCLLSKMSFDGDETLQTAEQLVQVAKCAKSPKQYSEAMLYLARAKLNVLDLTGAKSTLLKINVDGIKTLSADDRNAVQRLLIFCMIDIIVYHSLFSVYKHLHRVDDLNSIDLTNHFERMRRCEKIADELCTMEMYQLALDYYILMADNASTIDDRNALRSAVMSIATTAFDADKFELAHAKYQQLFMIEREHGFADDKLATTLVSIAKSAAHMVAMPFDTVLETFDRAIDAPSISTRDKIVALEELIDYLKRVQPMHERVKMSEFELKTLTEIVDDDDNEDENIVIIDESAYTDEYDLCSDEQILRRCKEEAKLQNDDEILKRDRTKKINHHGETRLHEAARSDNVDYVRKLVVDAGYDVNAQDYGGWTPLGEAVCANQIENVRFLLEHGANVDLRSNQPIENDIESSSGGLTPLMEAADLLHLPIIALLLQYNASVTAVNDEQWTAVDMLRFALQRAIANDDIDNDGIIEAERLIEQMQQKQIAANFKPRRSPPSRKSNNRSLIGRKTTTIPKQPTSAADLYKNVMNSIGPRIAKHPDTHLIIDDLSDDDDHSIGNGSTVSRSSTRRRLPSVTTDIDVEPIVRRSSAKRLKNSPIIRPRNHQRFDPIEVDDIDSFTPNYEDNINLSPPIRPSVEPTLTESAIITNTRLVKLTFEDISSTILRDTICFPIERYWSVGDLKQRALSLLTQDHGRTPIIRLKMSDGSELIDDNSLVYCFITESTSTAIFRVIVVEWQTQSLADRYESLAIADKCRVYTNWKQSLMDVDVQHKLCLVNQRVIGDNSLPLFRSLIDCHCLIEIDLSGNRLDHKQIKYLAQLDRCLQRLSLSACSLTCDSLKHFINSSNDSWPNIKYLNVSANAIGRSTIFIDFIRLFNCIESLNISMTMLTPDICTSLCTITSVQLLNQFEFGHNHQLHQNIIEHIYNICNRLNRPSTTNHLHPSQSSIM